MPDGWEAKYWSYYSNDFFDPGYNHPSTQGSDFDGDNLLNIDEANETTNPWSADTDNDYLTDDYEINITETSPINSDCDNDGLLDGQEVSQGLRATGTDPKDWDTDDDLLSDGWESQYGLNPLVSDVHKADTNG